MPCNSQQRSEDPNLDPAKRENFLTNLEGLGFNARSKHDTLLVLATLQGKVNWNNEYVTQGLKGHPIASLQSAFMEGSVEFQEVLSTVKTQMDNNNTLLDYVY